nr:putative baseplate assembly protein [Acidobacteriota bacterium]
MSSTGIYRCCDDRRRELVAAQATVNGIDYLEVVDHDAPNPAERQRILLVHFVNQPAPALTKQNVLIEGGERVTGIVADDVTVQTIKGEEVLVVHTTARGDYSPYTLRIVKGGTHVPHPSLDPPLSSIEFSFKVECAADVDCKGDDSCPEPVVEAPRIDYLAKDFSTFRRLMLDRISLLVPRWRDRGAADLGVTLVEMLAYVADHLSYRQDAVATEAYLDTARLRTSVRRHARLVDYVLHDGSNARCFVHVHATGVVSLHRQTQLYTCLEGVKTQLVPGSDAQKEAYEKGPLVFETMHDATLYPDVNEMELYTWGSQECCLPRGATTATLKGHYANLKKGDLVLFREMAGPRTGAAEDADPSHRQVVRLIEDASLDQDTLTGTDISNIVWHEEDALDFPLCVSARTDRRHKDVYLPKVSIAQGNIVVADHGESLVQGIGTVPAPALELPATSNGACDRSEPVAVLPRFRPRLAAGPLTFQAPYDAARSARAAMRWEMASVMPVVTVTELNKQQREWDVRRDLFESNPADRHFVADVEDDGIATLRFGDDEYGERPVAGTEFAATYRVGNGIGGKIGAEAIAHIVTSDSGAAWATNYIAATGGIDPESLEHARQSAPAAFRVQQRAVTEADYAEVTQRRADIDRAAATFRWTGSWYTVFDTIDRRGGVAVDDAFRGEIRHYLENYRVVGRDLEVDKPRFVSIDIAMTICVAGGHFRGDVLQALREVFTAGLRRDGTPGFFHPDRFTFGQPVVLSAVVAAAAAVEGVDAVFVTKFQRQGEPASD